MGKNDLSSKVTSLELSKALWNRGARVETEFLRDGDTGETRINIHFMEMIEQYNNNPAWSNIYPAYLLIELLEVMPRDLGEGRSFLLIFDLKPCNAVAKTLLWLIDEKHVEVKDGKIKVTD